MITAHVEHVGSVVTGRIQRATTYVDYFIIFRPHESPNFKFHLQKSITQLINSSLIETILNFEVFGRYKIMHTCGRVPRYIKSWGSMRPTKCDQAQVDWTLRSGVRVKNEGKFELFAVTRT